MAENSFLRLNKCFVLIIVALFCFTATQAQKVKEPAKDSSQKESVKEGENIAEIGTKKGRLPVIIIPGLIGSELVNEKTGDKVWFDLGRAKDDDIRLPISAKLSANRDNLVPGDILRSIQLIRFTPEIGVYEKLIKSLENDGYTEGKINIPTTEGGADTFYVFPYDWRLDNVENAQLLLKKLDKIRADVKNPNLKFNVIAHSMGGLITRYAAMYGKANLTATSKRPNWSGASYFNNVSLVAVPNGGSLSALNSLINGFSLFGTGKLNLPFVRNLTKYDLFTIPAVYQLLPHDGMVRAYDEDLKPMKVDVYDPKTWEKYGWLTFNDKEFKEKFSESEQKEARAYFHAVLLRAKLFQAALNRKPVKESPIRFYYLGSECKPTIDGMIIYQNKEDNSWKTEFEADSFTKKDGTKVTKDELKEVLYSPGDGVVPKRSLIASLIRIGKLDGKDSGIANDLTVVCGDHNRLTGEDLIGKSILNVIDLKARQVIKTVKP